MRGWPALAKPPGTVARRAAFGLETLLQQHAGEVAALIIEPLVQGAAGMAIITTRCTWPRRAGCAANMARLIADEIAVGFGRTGTLFAYEQAGVRRTFVFVQRGITGGYLPLSCVLTTDGVYAAFTTPDIRRGFLHSHSYTGNALACRPLAVLDILPKTTCWRKTAKAAAFARCSPAAKHPAVRHFRQQGMIWAFDVATTRSDFAPGVFSAMLEQAACCARLARRCISCPVRD